jgi:hypothetical protein
MNGSQIAFLLVVFLVAAGMAVAALRFRRWPCASA